MQQVKSSFKKSLIQHLILIFSLFSVLGAYATKPLPEPAISSPAFNVPYPHVEIVTNMGNIYLELDGIRAPISTRNFLEYVESGHYNGTIFHRVIPNFMAQGGGFDQELRELVTRPPIFNESGNGLSNLTGTIAMARTNDPHSATSQFYINVVDNEKLNPKPSRWGYTVFGDVLYGMPLVQSFVNVKTEAKGQLSKDVPVKSIIVESMRIMTSDEKIPLEVFSADDYEAEDIEQDSESTNRVKEEKE